VSKELLADKLKEERLTEKEIYEKTINILSEITGLEKEEMSLNSSLMEDLGIESFDIADLNFKISETFGIDAENAFLSIEGIVGNPEFMDEDNRLTKTGIKEIRSRIPTLEIPQEMMDNGVPILELINRITVDNLVSFIVSKKK
jgi:acyl carrier protein